MSAARCASQGVDCVGISKITVCDLNGFIAPTRESNRGARKARGAESLDVCCEHLASLPFASLAVPA